MTAQSPTWIAELRVVLVHSLGRHVPGYRRAGTLQALVQHRAKNLDTVRAVGRLPQLMEARQNARRRVACRPKGGNDLRGA